MSGLDILQSVQYLDGWSHCPKETYGQMDVDRDKVTGWFSSDPVELVDRYGGQWQTVEFEMGDALIFSMYPCMAP